MATNEEEINVINHLLQVEKDSALLIDDALQEADKRLSKARAEFNNGYKAKYDAGVAALDEKFQKDVELSKSEHEKSINEFKSSLENKNQNAEAFNKVLESLLFSDAK